MKGKLLSGVAAIAFGLGLVAAGPAVAGGGHHGGPKITFGDVDWSWDKKKWQTVDINTWIWSFFHPEGETEVEKLQVFVGDVEAEAFLKGDYVPQTLVMDGTVDFTVSYTGEHDDSDPAVFDGTAILGGDLTGSGSMLGSVDEGSDVVDLIATFTDIDLGAITVDLTQTAVDGLGHALQDVSAIGIADSIYSEFPVYAHEAQILVGGADDLDDVQNGFLTGLIEKAKVEATAQAGYVSFWYSNYIELAIDQDVSAVAEALSIDLASNAAPSAIATANDDEDDLIVDAGDTIMENMCDECRPEYGVFYPILTNNIIEANVAQFAYADVEASAKAYQDLTAFTNLGAYDRLGTAGLVANQSVSAAGLVADIQNRVQVPDATQ